MKNGSDIANTGLGVEELVPENKLTLCITTFNMIVKSGTLLNYRDGMSFF